MHYTYIHIYIHHGIAKKRRLASQQLLTSDEEGEYSIEKSGVEKNSRRCTIMCKTWRYVNINLKLFYEFRGTNLITALSFPFRAQNKI